MKKPLLLLLALISIFFMTACGDIKIPTSVSIDCGDELMVIGDSFIPDVTLYYDNSDEETESFADFYTLYVDDSYNMLINGTSLYANYQSDVTITVIPDYNTDISAECTITIVKELNTGD